MHVTVDPGILRQARRLAVVFGLAAVTLGAAAAAAFLDDTGVAVVIAASAVVISALLAWIAHEFLVGQGLDRSLRTRQREIELVRLQGDLVAVLRGASATGGRRGGVPRKRNVWGRSWRERSTDTRRCCAVC